MRICWDTLLKILIVALLGAALALNVLAVQRMRSVVRMLAAHANSPEAPPIPVPSFAEAAQHDEPPVSDSAGDASDTKPTEGQQDEAVNVHPAAVASQLPVIAELPEYDDADDKPVIEVKSSQQQAPPKSTKQSGSNSRNKKRKRTAPVVLPSVEISASGTADVNHPAEPDDGVASVEQPTAATVTSEEIEVVIGADSQVTSPNPENGADASPNEQSNAESH